MTLTPELAVASGRYSAAHGELDDVVVREDWYRACGWWTDELLHDFVLRHAREDPHAEAISAPGVRLTRGELVNRVLQASEAFRRLGAGPGARVVVQLPNEPEVVIVVLALARIGAAAVLAPPGLRIRELRHITEAAGGGIIVVSAQAERGANLAAGRKLTATCRSAHSLVITGLTDSASLAPGEYLLNSLCESAPASGPAGSLPAARPSDVAVYLLSGGTTGLPKLIPRTHRDYVYNLKVSAQAAELDRGSVYLGALPVCHNFALGCPGVLGTLAFGGRAVLSRGRTIDGVLATMAAENVTISAAVPSLAHRWAARALARPDLVSGLKLAVLQVGAARISAPQVADVTAALGCTVQQVYGMSEGLLAFTRHDDPPDVIAETQGRPASAGDQWRLVGDDGRDVPDGGSGELWVRGPYTVPGYFASAQVNEAAFSPEGWYGTGDIVRLHSSGNFIVAGRRRDFINRGGEKVSAAELEELIVTHPAVESAAAVAIPNEAFGEAICVFATVHGDDLELFELRRFLANHGVAAYKLPEQLEIVAELPVTAVGKVDKNALRKAAWRELGMSAHTDNSIVIEAPVEVVWEEVNRLEQWPVLFAEEYQRVEVLTTEADRVTFRITTKPQENGQSYSWVSERVLDREHHRVVARRLETGPFLYMHIVHSFEECPEGTRVRWVQDFEMKPRAPFTDTQMTSRINAGSEGNLRRHKQVIEEHWNGTTNG